MTRLRIVAAAMVLSTLTVTPIFAQAAIQEPGMFSFYHPNLDVLNGGAPAPAARSESEPPMVMQSYAARESGLGESHAPRRAYRARSRTLVRR